MFISLPLSLSSVLFCTFIKSQRLVLSVWAPKMNKVPVLRGSNRQVTMLQCTACWHRSLFGAVGNIAGLADCYRKGSNVEGMFLSRDDVLILKVLWWSFIYYLAMLLTSLENRGKMFNLPFQNIKLFFKNYYNWFERNSIKVYILKKIHILRSNPCTW